MYDVFIIGAGVVGAMTARELTRYRLSVCVADKENDVAMGATCANSAIVHAGFDAPEGSLKAKLNVAGAKMMPEIAQELGVRYKNNGSLVIGFDDGDRDDIQGLWNRGVRNGVKGLVLLNQAELREVEPNISPEAVCALRAPTGSIICPYELTVAAMGSAMDNGADLMLDFHVERITPLGDGYEISGSGKTVRASCVVNAAGLFSDEIARLAGDDSFAVRPRKGEYLLLDKECGGLVSHTIFRTPTKTGKGILVSPTVDGNLILGPTSEEIDDKTDRGTTQKGLEKIIREAARYVPKIPFGKVIASFAGLRAAGSGGDFILNMPRKGFVNAAGIDSPGLSAAPAIARYAVKLLCDAGLALDEKADFEPARRSMHFFQTLTPGEKNALIRQNSQYGKIICRCETVSEGEIVDAIRTNPKAVTLDGVKRRTRSGMGRCQGGFCSPAIVEILARELNAPMTEITKSGGGSTLLEGRTKGGDGK